MSEARDAKLRKEKLTVSHLPPDNISVILLAILGFSATQSTFILLPHVHLLWLDDPDSEEACADCLDLGP